MSRRLASLIFTALPVLAAPPMEGLVAPFRQMELPAPVASRIVALKAREGDAVKAGQPLVELYARPEELEVQRAKALLERREFKAKGARKLVADKVIPEAEALDMRIELELARLQHESALEQVRLRTLLAPFDGQVVELRREMGEAVSASQPVLRLVDLSQVYVHCMVKPELLARLAMGQKLTMRIPQATGEGTHTGEVVLLDPCAGPDGLFRVRLRVENPGLRIRAGLKALVDWPS